MRSKPLTKKHLNKTESINIMMNKIKIGLFCLLVFSGKTMYGQTAADTAAMVNEFSKVIAFTAQPSLYFSTIIKTDAAPVLEPQDTLTSAGIFYKNNTELYYKNGQEAAYLQDSFFIQVNQNRKTIWINKVDVASKEKMNVLPLNDQKVQELFRKRYTIQQSVLNRGESRLYFVTRKKADSSTTITTSITLEYSHKDYLPKLMQMDIHMQQPLSDDLLDALKNDNIDDTKLIQIIGGEKYLVRTQKVSVVFSEINNTKQKAMQMPLWKDILDFRETEQEFTAKGVYEGYEVTKMF